MSPFIFIFYIIIALIPGLFWLMFYRRKDRQHPEPLKLIVKVFLWGMVITLPAIGLELAVDYFFPYSQSTSFFVIAASALFVVAPIEEILKFFVVKERVYENSAFDEPIDGVIYAVVAALGFASLENILVVFSEGPDVIILRFATATLMHAITSGIAGYHLGLLKFGSKQRNYSPQRKKLFMAQGLAIAIILHGVYNIIAGTKTTLTIALISMIIVAMYFMLSHSIKELKKIKN